MTGGFLTISCKGEGKEGAAGCWEPSENGWAAPGGCFCSFSKKSAHGTYLAFAAPGREEAGGGVRLQGEKLGLGGMEEGRFQVPKALLYVGQRTA